MVSNKTLRLTLLTILCAWSAAAKFSFSPSQLRQFNIRHRRNVVGPSPAFRPAAVAPNTVTPQAITPNAIATPTPNTVTITVSTTSTTTSTATSLSTDTVFRASVASTTVTDTITAQAATPPPAVVHMHTTHIAIIPRETQAVYVHNKAQEKSREKSSEKPRMRKVHHRKGVSVSQSQNDQQDLSLAMPRSENIASIKQVHRERRASSELWRPASTSSSTSASDVGAVDPRDALLPASAAVNARDHYSTVSAKSTSAKSVNAAARDVPADLARLPVDALSGATGLGKSTTTTTSGTENNVNGDLDSARVGILDSATSNVGATISDLTTNVFGGIVDSEVASGPGSGAETGVGTGIGSNAEASSVDLVTEGVAPVGQVGVL